MKLGELRAAIRSTKGNPIAHVTFYEGGPTIPFALQKASVLTELETAFPGGKAVETGLTFDEKTGVLRAYADGGAAPQQVPSITAQAAPATALLTDSAPLDLTTDLLSDEPAPKPSATGLDDLLI